MKDDHETIESKLCWFFYENKTSPGDAFQAMFNVQMSLCMGKGMTHAQFKDYMIKIIDEEKESWEEVYVTVEAMDLMRSIK